MATTYCESIQDAVAYDETQLKEFVKTTVHESRSVNQNWINACARYDVHLTAPHFTVEYISSLILDQIEYFYTYQIFAAQYYPRVMILKSHPDKPHLSRALATDCRPAPVWLVNHENEIGSQSTHAALVPPGCDIEVHFMFVRFLAPPQPLIPNSQPELQGSEIPTQQ